MPGMPENSVLLHMLLWSMDFHRRIIWIDDSLSSFRNIVGSCKLCFELIEMTNFITKCWFRLLKEFEQEQKQIYVVLLYIAYIHGDQPTIFIDFREIAIIHHTITKNNYTEKYRFELNMLLSSSMNSCFSINLDSPKDNLNYERELIFLMMIETNSLIVQL